MSDAERNLLWTAYPHRWSLVLLRIAALFTSLALGTVGYAQAGSVVLDQTDIQQTPWPGIFAAPNLQLPAQIAAALDK